jgi:hypothetical protein
MSDDTTYDSDFDMLWIKFGIGGDIPIGCSFYFRTLLLTGFKLASQLEEDIASEIYEKLLGWDSASWTTFKLDIGVFFGYRFGEIKNNYY